MANSRWNEKSAQAMEKPTPIALNRCNGSRFLVAGLANANVTSTWFGGVGKKFEL